jgi:hypothetical protein
VLIALVIVGILAAIAIPSYQTYTVGVTETQRLRELDRFFQTKVLDQSEPPPRLKYLYAQPRYLAVSAVDKIYDSLPSAYTYIGAPEDMNLDDTRKVYVALSVRELTDVINLFGDDVSIKRENVKISNKVQVQIEGNDFEITPDSPPIQAVRQSAVTEWIWGIRAKREGTHSLTLNISAIVQVTGADTPLVLKTYYRNIDVNVRPTQRVWLFLKENGEWIWGPLVALFGGIMWLMRKWRARRTRGSGDTSQDTGSQKSEDPTQDDG